MAKKGKIQDISGKAKEGNGGSGSASSDSSIGSTSTLDVSSLKPNSSVDSKYLEPAKPLNPGLVSVKITREVASTDYGREVFDEVDPGSGRVMQFTNIKIPQGTNYTKIQKSKLVGHITAVHKNGMKFVLFNQSKSKEFDFADKGFTISEDITKTVVPKSGTTSSWDVITEAVEIQSSDPLMFVDLTGAITGIEI